VEDGRTKQQAKGVLPENTQADIERLREKDWHKGDYAEKYARWILGSRVGDKPLPNEINGKFDPYASGLEASIENALRQDGVDIKPPTENISLSDAYDRLRAAMHTPEQQEAAIKEQEAKVAKGKEPWQMTRGEFSDAAELLHGTTKENAEKIRKEGFRTSGVTHNYPYSELAADAIYAAPKGTIWFTDPESGRMFKYDEHVPVVLDPKARVRRIETTEQFNQLAKEAG